MTNCAALHINEDGDEDSKVKRRVNHHIADNWEKFYKNIIALPYEETVGVGEHSETIIITTGEEMLDFLRSDDSLMVYSNTQELVAMANIYNININIFTYGESENRWTEISPDPMMVSGADVNLGKWIPDMFLYHSSQCHYDLLVKDDSRLALLGVLAGAVSELNDDEHVDEKADNNHDWETVSNKKQKSRKNKSENIEELLVDEVIHDVFDTKDISEELNLSRAKKTGQRRSSPQDNADNNLKEKQMFKCDQCKHELESQGLLNAHKANQHEENFSCDLCDESFSKNAHLENHIGAEHNEKQKCEEFNCNDCSYQANDVNELVKHLKSSGHQPSQHVRDKRQILNECNFAKECWYVHDKQDKEKPSFVAEGNDTFKCDLCTETFVGRPKFMHHKKTKHFSTNTLCANFIAGKCDRNNEECWFQHEIVSEFPPLVQKPIKEQVFRSAPVHQFPPGQMSKMMEILNSLVSKVGNMEKRFQDLMDKKIIKRRKIQI